MEEFREFINTPPKLTKLCIISLLLGAVIIKLRLISYAYFFHSWERILFHFEIWRLVTPLFLANFSFQLFMNLYFMYISLSALELSQYKDKPADLIYFFLLSLASYNLFGAAFNLFSFHEAAVMSAIYLWAQLNKDSIVNFMFGIRFKAFYFPWVLLVLDFLMEHDYMASLAGILTGHLYFYLKFIINSPLMNTPQFLYRWFPAPRAPVSASYARAPVPPAEPKRSFAGQGYRLGG